MLSSAASIAAAPRVVLVCALAAGLGGCYTMGGGSKAPSGPAPSPAPAKFSPFSGTITSKGVVTQAVTNDYARTATLTVETKDQATVIEASVQAPNATTNTQTVDFKGGSGYLRSDGAVIESNGAAVRGHAVNSADTWAVYTNSPGSRLDASLGAPSLEHSYAGVAAFGKRAAGSTGTMYSYAAGFFGGATTSDMPTSGKAEYKGTFEGLEESTVQGSPLVQREITGVANLTADFAAKTVRGRIDDINNHSAGPVKVPTDYSLAFSGVITQSNFAGAAWMTQRNTDAPLGGFTQNTGVVQGGFFGSGAAEAAGALGVAANDDYRKFLITGAFGAKKK